MGVCAVKVKGESVNRAEKLLEQAAVETLERIRRDQERAPARIKPLLAYLQDHLFEPQLDFNQLKRACNIRDNTIPIQFHTALELPPYAYIEDCRLETACRLLRDTELKIWQITQLLGYSSIQVFSRAFGRWSGLRPTAYRKRERQRIESEAVARDEEPPTPAKPMRVETLRRGLKGTLDDEEAEGLIRQLLELYPVSAAAVREQMARNAPLAAGDPTAVPGGTAGQRASAQNLNQLLSLDIIQRIRVEEIWAELARHEEDEQRDMVRRRLRLGDPALFRYLLIKSRELGREDRQEGVRVARLALDSLEALSDWGSAADRANLTAQGWAWYANALRLAFDFPAADEAFRQAELSLPESDRDLEVEAEIWSYQGSLRWTQRRFEEALELSSRAIELLRGGDAPDLLAQSLILKGLVHHTSGDPGAGIPQLREALELLDADVQPYLMYAALYNLARCYTEVGEVAEAEKILPRAKEFVERAPNRELRLLLSWLEALIDAGHGRLDAAKERLEEVREGFGEIQEPAHAAVASIDLARLYEEEGQTRDVLRVVAETLPVLEALRAGREMNAALKLLHQAVEKRKVDRGMLEEVRATLARWRPESARLAVGRA